MKIKKIEKKIKDTYLLENGNEDVVKEFYRNEIESWVEFAIKQAMEKGNVKNS